MHIFGVVLLLCALLPTTVFSAPEAFFSPEGGIRQRLIQAIEGARRTIDLAVYQFTARELAEALQAAQARGVHIRILLDRETLRAGTATIRRLRRSGLLIRTLGIADQSLMHNKFAVFDGRLAATGSYNWTRSAEHANYENLVVLDDPDVVAQYQREFQRLWLESKE